MWAAVTLVLLIYQQQFHQSGSASILINPSLYSSDQNFFLRLKNSFWEWEVRIASGDVKTRYLFWQTDTKWWSVTLQTQGVQTFRAGFQREMYQLGKWHGHCKGINQEGERVGIQETGNLTAQRPELCSEQESKRPRREQKEWPLGKKEPVVLSDCLIMGKIVFRRILKFCWRVLEELLG